LTNSEFEKTMIPLVPWGLRDRVPELWCIDPEERHLLIPVLIQNNTEEVMNFLGIRVAWKVVKNVTRKFQYPLTWVADLQFVLSDE
jgi:hypothetical protein